MPRRAAIATRLATCADLPFLDQLQKQHGRALGFFPRAQMEGYVQNQWVLIAEDAATRQPLGYCASRDRYLKRDELGVIYQLCVAPGHQRGLIGATLIREVFDRSAYGCKLFCCWCAQDLAANHFWESMGFVPIAFRAGSDKKRRVHIFWQRRINAEDAATPYWYPSMTNQGAIREDRLVFPIPPGVHWSEVRAVAVPDVARASRPCLEAPGEGKDMGQTPMLRKKPAMKPAPAPLGGFRFQTDEPKAHEKPKRVRVAKGKVKINPHLAAKARELRDRCMERQAEWLPAGSRGKYDVARALGAESSAVAAPLAAPVAAPLLPAA
jgi:ribosomal protein S18 acetylase RimI-like enzyme